VMPSYSHFGRESRPLVDHGVRVPILTSSHEPSSLSLGVLSLLSLTLTHSRPSQLSLSHTYTEGMCEGYRELGESVVVLGLVIKEERTTTA
jgi:hypothetical protein